MISGIYSLCDNTLTPHLSHFELAQRLLAGGVSILQLRMKGETDLKKIQEITSSILTLKKKYSFTFILNDFVEIARGLPVDGVHVGQDDLGISEVRKKISPAQIVGYSSHSLSEAQEAERLGVDYVAFGAIFPTATKGPNHPVQGITKLRELVDRIKIPIVAIGGIHRNNFTQVLETGVSSIAMISALTTATNISEEAKWFVQKMQK